MKQGSVRLQLVIVFAILLLTAACNLASSGTSSESIDLEGPPIVNLSLPLPNATVRVGTAVEILARIENAGSDIQRVEILVNNDIMGTTQEFPNASGAATFSIRQDWTASTIGQYQIDVVAYRQDETYSESAAVTVNVVEGEQAAPTLAQTTSTTGSTNPTPTIVQNQSIPTATTASNAPAPTQVPAVSPTSAPPPASATPTTPRLTVINATGANVRGGPGVVYAIIGGLGENDTADIIGINPAGDWYKIQFGAASGWIFASLTSPSGNLSNLPVDAGPPPPPPPTAVPPTIPPVPTSPPSLSNLQVMSIIINPHPLVCGQTATIQVLVQNTGTEATTDGGLIAVVAQLASTGETLEATQTTFPALGPGQQHTAAASLTVSVHHSTLQRVAATVDSDNRVIENNESDNTTSAGTDYVLAQGSCP